MENKVNPATEVPMIPEGFITLPNHTNCAKFEGNLSPPSAHGKVLVSLLIISTSNFTANTLVSPN